MFKAKYKAHKLINILFYGIFWLSGFLIGYGLNGGGYIEKIKEFFNFLVC